MISRARKEYGIDFENPAAMAKAAEDDELRDRYKQMQKKLDILESAIQSQKRKFKQKTKVAQTKLDAFKDR